MFTRFAHWLRRFAFKVPTGSSVCFVILKVQVYYKVRCLPSEQKHENSWNFMRISKNAANTRFYRHGMTTQIEIDNLHRAPHINRLPCFFKCFFAFSMIYIHFLVDWQSTKPSLPQRKTPSFGGWYLSILSFDGSLNMFKWFIDS